MKFLKNSLKHWMKIFGTFSHKDKCAEIKFPEYEDFRTYLPKYLSDEDQRNLFSSLKDFPKNIDQRFYSSLLNRNGSLFQGDLYKEVLMPNYNNQEFRPVKGFLISNTCDASSENARISPIFLTFAPIISLSKYEEALKAKHSDEEKVDTHIQAIRRQQISSIFYLPAPTSMQEMFVPLDKLFSIPPSCLLEDTLKEKRIAVLSNLGFYMLLFKLSVHFSRVQETVQRG